jgi:hypothetical protein
MLQDVFWTVYNDVADIIRGDVHGFGLVFLGVLLVAIVWSLWSRIGRR